VPDTQCLGEVVRIHSSRVVLVSADDGADPRDAGTEPSPPMRVRAWPLGAAGAPDYDRFRDAGDGVDGDLDGHGGPA
jgi:hypothetical protein